LEDQVGHFLLARLLLPGFQGPARADDGGLLQREARLHLLVVEHLVVDAETLLPDQVVGVVGALLAGGEGDAAAGIADGEFALDRGDGRRLQKGADAVTEGHTSRGFAWMPADVRARRIRSHSSRASRRRRTSPALEAAPSLYSARESRWAAHRPR